MGSLSIRDTCPEPGLRRWTQHRPLFIPILSHLCWITLQERWCLIKLGWWCSKKKTTMRFKVVKHDQRMWFVVSVWFYHRRPATHPKCTSMPQTADQDCWVISCRLGGAWSGFGLCHTGQQWQRPARKPGLITAKWCANTSYVHAYGFTKMRGES